NILCAITLPQFSLPPLSRGVFPLGSQRIEQLSGGEVACDENNDGGDCQACRCIHRDRGSRFTWSWPNQQRYPRANSQNRSPRGIQTQPCCPGIAAFPNTHRGLYSS